MRLSTGDTATFPGLTIWEVVDGKVVWFAYGPNIPAIRAAAGLDPEPTPRRLPRRMPLDTKAIGKKFPSAVYAVGREKIKEYARAAGETNPIHLDHEAARAAGYADVVAPPMFAVVY